MRNSSKEDHLRQWMVRLYAQYRYGQKRYWKWTPWVQQKPGPMTSSDRERPQEHEPQEKRVDDACQPGARTLQSLRTKNLLFLGLGKESKYTGLSGLNRTINLNLTKTIGGIRAIRSVLIVSAYFQQSWPTECTLPCPLRLSAQHLLQQARVMSNLGMGPQSVTEDCYKCNLHRTVSLS